MKFLLMVITVTVFGLASCKKDDGCVTCKKYPMPKNSSSFLYEEICEGSPYWSSRQMTEFFECDGMPLPCSSHYIYDCTY